MSPRERVLAGMLLVAAGVAWWRPWEGSPPAWVGAGLMTRQLIAPLKDEAPRVAAPARARPADAPPNVIFVVLDTVRADHTSTCGYALPTTPRLQALVAAGAGLACRAIAPADWTLPSHASFFTGRSPLEHGARFAAAEDAGDIEGVPLVPLGGAFQTLAESFRARGYHTLLVAANPMLQAPTGLARGFDVVDVGTRFHARPGVRMVESIADALREVPIDGKPIFLFVNLLDAHGPWDASAPEDPDPRPRPAIDLFLDPPGGGPTIWEQFTTRWSAAERAAFVPSAVAGYDAGVHRADAALGAILDLLRDTGWTSGPQRLVVTSDHGEFLGDHDLLDHGRYLYEVNQRIPVVWQESGRVTVLPDELPGLAIHDLVLDGKTPAPGVTLTASWPDRFWSGHSGGKIGNEIGVARWGVDGTKLWWRAGRYFRTALPADPKEEHLTEVDAGAVPVDLRDAVERAQAMSAPVDAADLPADLKDALRAVGYVE